MAGLLALAAALPIYALYNDRTEENRLRQAELVQLQTECSEMETSNQLLRQRIRALQEDPRYLEVRVRSELGWVKEDELLFQFDSRSEAEPRSGGARP